MRIAVLTTSFPDYPGHPAGHFVECEARLLAQGGHDVHVIAPEAALANPLSTWRHVTVHRCAHGGALGWPGAKSRISQRPYRIFGLAHYVLLARRLASELNADRTIVHWAFPGLAMVPKGARQVRFVSHGEDVRTLCALPARVRERWVESALDCASAWTFVSEALRQSLEQRLSPRTVQALRQIANIEPAPVHLPDLVRAPRKPPKRRLISIGRLVSGKRVDRTIAYLARLPQDSAELIVVGDGPVRASLEAQARAAQVDAIFLGLLPRPEALGWLASADELLMASEQEGLSTVVREAEALNVPIRYL